MAPERLILHCGLPKTGTTAMQRWFRSQAPALQAAGIVYPERFGPTDDKHGFLGRELLGAGAMRGLEQVLQQADQPTILMSHEGLSNHFDDASKVALDRFNELTRGLDKTVVLVTRDPEKWLRSYHKQCVLNPNNGASDLWGTAQSRDALRGHVRIRRLMDPGNFAGEMAAAFRARHLITPNYDAPGWFEGLLEQMGLGSVADQPLPRMNESVPDWAVEFMRGINGRIDSTAGRRAWLALLQHHLRSSHAILRDIQGSGPALLSREVLDRVAGGVVCGAVAEEAALREFVVFARSVMEGARTDG